MVNINVLQFIKSSWKAYVIIFTVTGILLFVPPSLFIELVGFCLPDSLKPYILFFFLLSAVLMLYHISTLMLDRISTLMLDRISTCFKNVYTFVVRKKEKHKITNSIKKISHEEMAILKEFVIQNSDSIYVPVQDETVSVLIEKGMLFTGFLKVMKGNFQEIWIKRVVADILESEHFELPKTERPEWYNASEELKVETKPILY